MTERASLISDLASIVGEKNISDSILDRITYSQDTLGPDLNRNEIPIAVVRPGSVREVSGVMKYANKYKVPVHIYGRGTAFIGSPRPKRSGCIILSTSNLKSFEMHEEDLYFEVGAGMNQADLEKMLQEKGYMLPMMIGSRSTATIGGAISINTIGHMVDPCLGRPIDYVMGIEAVLPTGEIIETGTTSIRRPAGIDYTKFFVGSEGEFGVITRIRMRLQPDLKKAYVVGFFKDPKDIAYGFMHIYHDKLPFPLYGEFMEEKACITPFKLRGLGKPIGSMALAIMVDRNQEYANHSARQVAEVFKAEKAIEAHFVTSSKEQTDLWACRESFNLMQVEEGQEKLTPAGGVEISVPLSKLADTVEYIRSGHPYSILHEVTEFMYGHIGACDLHVRWAAPASYPSEKRMKCARAADDLQQEIQTRLGTAYGEIGHTATRIPFLRKRYGEEAYAMLLNFKKAIDPNNILNPGNLQEGEQDGKSPFK